MLKPSEKTVKTPEIHKNTAKHEIWTASVADFGRGNIVYFHVVSNITVDKVKTFCLPVISSPPLISPMNFWHESKWQFSSNMLISLFVSFGFPFMFLMTQDQKKQTQTGEFNFTPHTTHMLICCRIVHHYCHLEAHQLSEITQDGICIIWPIPIMEKRTSSRAADFTKKDKNALQEVRHMEAKQLLVGMVGISLCCSRKL